MVTRRAPKQDKRRPGEPLKELMSIRLKPSTIHSIKTLGDGNKAMGVERLHSLMIHMCQGDSYDVAYKKACGIIGV